MCNADLPTSRRRLKPGPPAYGTKLDDKSKEPGIKHGETLISTWYNMVQLDSWTFDV